MRLIIATLALVLSGSQLAAEQYLPEKSNIADTTASWLGDVNSTLVIAILTFLTAMIGVVMGIRNKTAIQEVHLSVNSRLSELLAKTEEAAHASGVVVGTVQAETVADKVALAVSAQSAEKAVERVDIRAEMKDELEDSTIAVGDMTVDKMAVVAKVSTAKKPAAKKPVRSAKKKK